MNIIYLHTSLKKCGPTSQLLALISLPQKSVNYFLFLLRRKNAEDFQNPNIEIISSFLKLIKIIKKINNT